MINKIIVNVTDRKDKKHILEGSKGQTLMQLIDQYEIAYPYGVCGGFPDCGTCHVYVDKDWYEKLPKKEEGEEDMLDLAYEPNCYSRLSCQIMISNELEGLIVRLPSKQA